MASNPDITTMSAEPDNVQRNVTSGAARRLNAILGFCAPDRETARAAIERSCAALAAMKARKAVIQRERHREANRQRANARYERLKDDPAFMAKQAEAARRWQRAHPLAYRAQRMVKRRVKKGKLPPATDFDCVDCGKPATDYEHRDYTKPLEVVPTCRSCNLRRGSGYPYNR